MRRFTDLARVHFSGFDGDVMINEVTLSDGRHVPGCGCCAGVQVTTAAKATVDRIATRGGNGSRIARTIDGVSHRQCLNSGARPAASTT